MRGGKKFVSAPIIINMSLAIGANVMGILLSKISQFFIRSMHLSTCILRLAIFCCVPFLPY